MDGKFRTSFIPKGHTVQEKKKQRRRPVSVLAVVSLVVFFGSVAGVIGLSAYDNFLRNKISELDEQLVSIQDDFKPELTRDLIELDYKIRTANTLLATHIAPSRLLNLIETLTVRSISYSKMDYSLDNGQVFITLDGRAPSYTTVALQGDIMVAFPGLIQKKFSGVDLTEDGDVTFTATATLRPDELFYSNYFSQPES